MKHRIGFVWLLALGLAFVPRASFAAFHLMEIEKVIGGVGGDTTAQAIQLKIRVSGNNLVVGSAQVVVRDATGANPVTIATFSGTNPANGACREILLATPNMSGKTTPALVPDFPMSPIPASYLNAGSLTFESLGGGTTWWRVSWGAYSGPQTVIAGASFNDVDGITSPAATGPVPSAATSALEFISGCPNLSVTNAGDYGFTASAPATLKSNPGTVYTLANLLPVPALPGASKLLLPALLALSVVVFGILRRRANA